MSWLIVGPLLAAILLVGGYFAWKTIRSIFPPWKPLPGYPGTKYMAPAGVTPESIASRLSYALDVYAKYTKWDARTIDLYIRNLQINVREEETWEDPTRMKVAGQSFENTVDVGKSMLALGHELGHWLEWCTEKKIDFAHAGWEENGIRKAEAEYESWLKNKSWN